MARRTRATSKRRRPRPKKKPARAARSFRQTLAAPFSWMRTHWQTLALIFGLTTAAAGFWKYRQAEPPAPVAPVNAALKQQVDAALVGPQAAMDRQTLAALYAALAQAIEYDGGLQAPQITTVDELQRLQEVGRAYALDGATLAQKYPALLPIVADAIQAAVGNEAIGLEPPARAQAAAPSTSTSAAPGASAAKPARAR